MHRTTLIVLALAACSPAKRPDPPVCPTIPVVVDRIVETRAAIPVDLIEPLDDPTHDAEATTVGEASRYAAQRRALVARCQIDRAQLRALQETP